jgi:NAD(P)H-hydrate epimerase
VVVFAGSRGMSGAAVLTGTTALRGGAGLVTMAVPESVRPAVCSHDPSLMTIGLPENARGQVSVRALSEVLSLSAKADAVACGPGWGASSSTRAIATALYRQAECPVVFDADALNVLALELRDGLEKPRHPRVLTPHPGEFSRLTGLETKEIQVHREDAAAEFAKTHGVVLLLKGHETVITDGERVALNSTGNPGLATGGAGDVLTGLITAFLAGGMPAFEAAHLAAHVHGLAADLIVRELSEPGLIASDLPRAIARVLADARHPSS